ncbi:MAG: hypothetical protein ABI072_09555, partial [Edaphobacter sp.]
WVWGPELIRRSGVNAPRIAEVSGLTPWSMVESEVIAQFGPFDEEVAWNLGKDATYLAGPVDARLRIELTFDLSLLQTVAIHTTVNEAASLQRRQMRSSRS